MWCALLWYSLFTVIWNQTHNIWGVPVFVLWPWKTEKLLFNSSLCWFFLLELVETSCRKAAPSVWFTYLDFLLLKNSRHIISHVFFSSLCIQADEFYILSFFSCAQQVGYFQFIVSNYQKQKVCNLFSKWTWAIFKTSKNIWKPINGFSVHLW